MARRQKNSIVRAEMVACPSNLQEEEGVEEKKEMKSGDRDGVAAKEPR